MFGRRCVVCARARACVVVVVVVRVWVGLCGAGPIAFVLDDRGSCPTRAPQGVPFLML
eukprot:COSAG02_NODE_1010_length_15227_cov_5.846774_15_plen_58_part_00